MRSSNCLGSLHRMMLSWQTRICLAIDVLQACLQLLTLCFGGLRSPLKLCSVLLSSQHQNARNTQRLLVLVKLV